MNWCGYSFDAPSGTTVNSVQAEWAVPAANGSVTPNSYASFWVGIDGANLSTPFNGQTIEQIGTDSEVVNGVPQYYAWYEMYPAGEQKIAITISPGNSMAASVQYATSGAYAGEFDLSIADATTGVSYSNYFSPPGGTTALRNSAEWVAEAPWTINNRGDLAVLPLSEFGTMSFSGDSASLSNGVSGPIGAFSSCPSYDSITMVATSSSSGLGATPSPLDPTGSSFTIATTSPGDADSDGEVDVNDLSIVLANFGKTSGMWWATGDFTGDGTVDINDLTEVLANFGTTLGASAAGVAAVPEPGALALSLAAALTALLSWRRAETATTGTAGAGIDLLGRCNTTNAVFRSAKVLSRSDRRQCR
jgi:hypothetical protein